MPSGQQVPIFRTCQPSYQPVNLVVDQVVDLDAVLTVDFKVLAGKTSTLLNKLQLTLSDFLLWRITCTPDTDLSESSLLSKVVRILMGTSIQGSHYIWRQP